MSFVHLDLADPEAQLPEQHWGHILSVLCTLVMGICL